MPKSGSEGVVRPHVPAPEQTLSGRLPVRLFGLLGVLGDPGTVGNGVLLRGKGIFRGLDSVERAALYFLLVLSKVLDPLPPLVIGVDGTPLDKDDWERE